MKAFSKLIFRLFGWKITGSIPSEINQAVMIIAPHTSFMDFIIGRLAFNILGRKAKFIIKKEFFFFPLGFIIKGLGGIPVDRKKGIEAFSDVNKIFKTKKKVILIITPEGSRKPINKWKKGFHLIARNNAIPLIMGSLDYEKKIANISEPFNPSNELKEDLESIRNYYKNVKGKFPNKYIPDFK